MRIRIQSDSIMVRARKIGHGLIWVDMEPLLEVERKRCESVLHKTEELRATIDRYNQVSDPAFTRWLYSHFGQKITEVRELSSQLHELHSLVNDVNRVSYYSRCSKRKAYEEVLRQREDLKRQMENPDAFRHQENTDASENEFSSSDNDFDHDQNGGDRMPPELESLVQKTFEENYGSKNEFGNDLLYESLFGQFRQSFGEEVLGWETKNNVDDDSFGKETGDEEFADHDFAGESVQPVYSSSPSDSDELRLKRLYRSLARKLHPDLNKNLTARLTSLWHDVQAAYEAGDLEKLETLSAMAESNEEGFGSIRSVSRLRAIYEDHVMKQKAMEKQIRSMKKNPAWNFERNEKSPKKFAKLSKKIDADLSESIDDISAQISFYSEQVESWSKKRKQTRVRVGRGTR